MRKSFDHVWRNKLNLIIKNNRFFVLLKFIDIANDSYFYETLKRCRNIYLRFAAVVYSKDPEPGSMRQSVRVHYAPESLQAIIYHTKGVIFS